MLFLAWGLVVTKVAAAVALADAWQLAPVWPDAALLLALALLALRWPRAANISGALLGLYCVLNVGLIAAVGTPLVRSLFSYASEVKHVAPRDLAGGTGALLAFAVGVALLRRARLAPTPALAVGAASLVLAGALALARGAPGTRDNPVAALAASLLPAAADGADGARVPFDAPLGGARGAVPVARDAGAVRHVVVWLAESVGARHTSLHGGDPRATPELARLAEHALVADAWSANAPVSAKAIFTALCGLYPLPEGTFESRAFPRIACPSLMETLAARGWRAALFHGGYFAFTDKLALLEERGFDVLMDGESVPDRDRWFTNGWGIDDAALVEHGLAWLDATRAGDAAAPNGDGARTLAVYIPLVPHYEYWLPPGAPRPFGSASLQARYRNGVAYTDAMFGRLVEGYRERGILDDTLFVFLGDHGEAFEEHAKNKLHAGFLYEENVHVPAVFASTRLFPAQVRTARAASHVDLVPTLLDLVGVPPPPPLAGTPGLQGQALASDAWEPRPVMLATFYPEALFGLRARTLAPGDPADTVASDWKYVRRARDGHEELYDLVADPRERTNVVAAHPALAQELRARTYDFAERQRALLEAWPALGPSFLDRAAAAMRVVSGQAAGEAAGGDAFAIVRERSFNMERRCLLVRAPPPGAPPLVLATSTTPPARLVGIGLTDRARFARGAPVRARFTRGDEVIELEVNDVFETTSKVRSFAARPAADEASGAELRIEIAPAAGRDRTACITLAP